MLRLLPPQLYRLLPPAAAAKPALPIAEPSPKGDAFVRQIHQPTFASQNASTITPAQVVVWYQKRYGNIPPLNVQNRQNHRIHLALVGQLLSLLPAVPTAQAAFAQYKKLFNAVENASLPKNTGEKGISEKGIRMYCHENKLEATDKQYGVLTYGFHLLIFAPNGAVESYRLTTPPAVEVNEGTETDFSQRVKLFGQVAKDAEALGKLLAKAQPGQAKRPKRLRTDGRYQCTFSRPGTDGKDPWGQDLSQANHPYLASFRTDFPAS